MTASVYSNRSLGGCLAFSCAVLALLALCGCATERVTDPQRTATEQFLLSQAVAQAVEPLSFEALHGRRVYVDDRFFGAPEKAFVLGELRARLLLAGVQVSPNEQAAEIILEVRSAGIGVDRYDSILGIPSIGAPSTGITALPTTIITPEIAIVKEIRQVSFASVAYVAYWASTGEVVASSGPSLGKAWRDDWWLFGFGPRTIGSIAPVDHHVE
ncbi:MAG: hypothetical protein JW955_15805 [Sedimentisphaerales bacterium]|nr:hypothetical protein [Sedimentisphaerales bacterium]